MCRTIIIGLTAAMAILAPAKAETLNLLTWEKYLSSRVLEAWKAESGTELNQIYFDSGESRDSIIANGNSEIDLAVMNESVTKVFKKQSLLEEISEGSVPSIKNSVPRWRAMLWVRTTLLLGTLGIVYRADKLAVAPTSWTDLLSPAPELAGHIAMVGGFDDLLTPSLILNGKSINTQQEADLKAAYATLKAQAPSVRTYDYIVTSAQDGKIGPDLYMALAYSGDQFALNKDSGQDWRYVLPKEGSVLWVDCMGVLAASKQKDLALRFLDFLNRPEIAAMNAADLMMPTANEAAIPLLPETMRTDTQVFPSKAVIDSSAFYEENSAHTVQVRKRISNALISFHDAR